MSTRVVEVGNGRVLERQVPVHPNAEAHQVDGLGRKQSGILVGTLLSVAVSSDEVHLTEREMVEKRCT
jgi:hypothetical protein